MADHISAIQAQEAGVIKSTHQKQNRAWTRWTEYCKQLEIRDPYLSKWDQLYRVRLIYAFMHIFHTGRFSKQEVQQLSSGYTRESVHSILATIRSRNERDPRLDLEGNIHINIHRQTRC